ncbi:unnamed protein product [Pylaiella littoralis]
MSSSSSGNNTGASMSVSSGVAVASSSRGGSLLLTNAGGSSRIRDGLDDLDMKPPPTEPSVHGPLQYTGRGSMPGGHGPAPGLAPVRLPGLPSLAWSSAPASSILPHPPLLPGISNIRRLSVAAGSVLAPENRLWPGGGGGGGGGGGPGAAGSGVGHQQGQHQHQHQHQQQRGDDGQDGSMGVAVSGGGQQQQLSQAGGPLSAMDSGRSQFGQGSAPSWGGSGGGGGGGGGVLGVRVDRLGDVGDVDSDTGDARSSFRWEHHHHQRQSPPPPLPQPQQLLGQPPQMQQQQQQQHSLPLHTSLAPFQHSPPGHLPASSQPQGRSG